VTTVESNNEQSYLALGRLGKSTWWRYVLRCLLIVASYIIGDELYYSALTAIAGGHLQFNRKTFEVSGIHPLIVFIATNIVFLVLMAGIWLTVRCILRRSFLSLITPNNKLSFQRIGFGIAVWGILDILVTLIGCLTSRQTLEFTLRLPEFLCFLPAVLLLTPLQCLGEELYCRAYVLQGLSSVITNRWLLAAVSSILFTMPHLFSPFMMQYWLVLGGYFFAIGILLAMVTIRTNSLEVALGAHIGHNFFELLLVRDQQFPIRTSTLFVASLDRSFELGASIVSTLVFYFLAVRFIRRNGT